MIVSAEIFGKGNDRRQALTEQQPLEILFKIICLMLINRDYYN